MNESALHALQSAEPRSFWLDQSSRPEPLPALTGDVDCDLVVVGGGFTGLWTALLAKEADPKREVVILEANEVGWAATGRNGGFVAASLTHGLLNGLDRFPDELDILERMGRENLDAMRDAVQRYGIDCDWLDTGELDVAVADWQTADLEESAKLMAARGHDVELLNATQVQDRVASPTYRSGLFDPHGVAMVDPARLAWGLKRACLQLGVRIYENTKATRLAESGTGVAVATPWGVVRAAKAALASNAFPPLLRRIRSYVVPVYDYVLVTEPLSASQREAIRWGERFGIGDAGNQFHYYRLTEDGRILWGGYDAIYHFRNGLNADLDQRPSTFAALAEHFFDTFPQLEGLTFTHRWGGAIDTCSRFCAFWGTAHRGKVAYVAGYTGLGVGATRFGAQVMLDLVDGRDTERTRLRMVKSKPLPFPPEPLRFVGIELTRRSLAKADRNDGKRDAWLRTLDKVGLGFDS